MPQEIQIMQKYKRKRPLTPGGYRQTNTPGRTIDTHQIIVRPPILTSFKILSLKDIESASSKGEFGEGNFVTSIRPSIRFLISIGFGWNRGISSRVTSLMRSLWTMCFRSFMTLTIHAYKPPVRSFLIQGATTSPPFGVFVPRRSCHVSPSVLRCSRLSTRSC